MRSLVSYKAMPIWNKQTLPEAFMQKHNTQEGTWAKLHIIRGSLDFVLLTQEGEVTESFHFTIDTQPPLIKPQQWHRIAAVSDDIECQLTFYCQPEDYTQKKYQLTKTHSQVIKAASMVKPGKALDLGCGTGRNALYLNLLGFDVTALDKSITNIEQLKVIADRESLSYFHAENYDINHAALTDNYDFIVSTVVMMFLDPKRIADVISNMQAHTVSGGYNLIVSAMSTDDCPCNVPFSFTFKENELKQYYQGWHIKEYNENIGELHKTDLQGNRIKLRFATLLARKN